MSAERSRANGSVELHPHQEGLIRTLLAPNVNQPVVLRSAPGMGKTTAISLLVGRALHDGISDRVLLICPAILREQWLDRLEAADVPVVVIDRYVFRELIDAKADADIWPSRKVLVLSDAFATQPDVRRRLSESRFDLLVVDEAHRFVGDNAAFLRDLGSRTTRVVATTGTESGALEAFPLENAIVIDWRFGHLLDREHRLLGRGPTPTLNEVVFHFSPTEARLTEAINSLIAKLSAADRRHRLMGHLIQDLQRSSIAAVEGTLRRLASSEGNYFQQSEGNELDKNDREDLNSLDSDLRAEISGRAATILDIVESIQMDSKLDRFVSLIDQLALPRSGDSMPACVLTRYKSTMYYLAAELENRHIAVTTLEGGSSRVARALAAARGGHGIIIATYAALVGLELGSIRDVVLYDLPEATEALIALLARFSPIGSSLQITIHAFLSGSEDDADNQARIEGLRHWIAGQPD